MNHEINAFANFENEEFNAYLVHLFETRFAEDSRRNLTAESIGSVEIELAPSDKAQIQEAQELYIDLERYFALSFGKHFMEVYWIFERQ